MIEIIDCEQGTPEWFVHRAGIPTASEFSSVLAQGKGGAESKTRRTYMLKLLGEQLTGKPEDGFTNAHMERGKTMEEEARNAYAVIADDLEIRRVGFVINRTLIKGRVVGCSPDSLIDPSGTLEIKTRLARLQIELLLAGEIPSEHKAQCQGALWVCEREWLEFVSYWPGLKPFIKRVYRDESYIAALKIAVTDFLDEMDALKQRLAA